MVLFNELVKLYNLIEQTNVSITKMKSHNGIETKSGTKNTKNELNSVFGPCLIELILENDALNICQSSMLYGSIITV